jgi:hypothetical protein
VAFDPDVADGVITKRHAAVETLVEIAALVAINILTNSVSSPPQIEATP